MHVPLLARTRSPTFYLYGRTIFRSRIILTCKIFRVKFKTSRLHILWNKSATKLCQDFTTFISTHRVSRDFRAILQPQGYRLQRLQPQHIFARKWSKIYNFINLKFLNKIIFNVNVGYLVHFVWQFFWPLYKSNWKNIG
jgi:hypothetical protein